jgi:hypothetical protein
MVAVTQVERLARVEVEVSALRKDFEEHKSATADGFVEVNHKLDDLLALRNKGAGAFWIATSLIGAGIVGYATQFIKWLIGN